MPFLDRINQGVATAKFKADQLLRINRVQSEIGDLRRQIANTRDKIASAVIEIHRQSSLSHPELEEFCRGIDQIEAQIVEKEALIASIRAKLPPQTTPTNPASTPCPNCRADVPVEAAFCTSCGKPMPKPAPESTSSNPVINNKCADCGFSNPPEATFCTNCGQALKTPDLS